MSGKYKYQKNYEQIVNCLRSAKHTVFEETVEPSRSYVYEEISDDEKALYYKQILKWMNQSDVIVVEASYSSLSIGHEITVALEKGKPVVVLYSENEAPHFLVGIKSEKLVIEKYSLKNLKNVLLSSIDFAMEGADTRFNFFISPKIANYLDWIARKKRTPRAVYLRRLIERDMKESKLEI